MTIQFRFNITSCMKLKRKAQRDYLQPQCNVEGTWMDQCAAVALRTLQFRITIWRELECVRWWVRFTYAACTTDFQFRTKETRLQQSSVSKLKFDDKSLYLLGLEDQFIATEHTVVHLDAFWTFAVWWRPFADISSFSNQVDINLVWKSLDLVNRASNCPVSNIQSIFCIYESGFGSSVE